MLHWPRAPRWVGLESAWAVKLKKPAQVFKDSPAVKTVKGCARDRRRQKERKALIIALSYHEHRVPLSGSQLGHHKQNRGIRDLLSTPADPTLQRRPDKELAVLSTITQPERSRV